MPLGVKQKCFCARFPENKQVIILNTEILPTYTGLTMIEGYVEINQPKTKFYHAKLN